MLVVPRRPGQGPGPGVAGGRGWGSWRGAEAVRESRHEPKIDPGQRAVVRISTADCLPTRAEGGGLGCGRGGGQWREGRDQA